MTDYEGKTTIEIAKDAFARLMKGRPRIMRRFRLRRTEDESGVSGTGDVAEGIVFTSGKAVLNWTTEHTSVAIYDSLDELMAIHGHDGKTILVWIDA